MDHIRNDNAVEMPESIEEVEELIHELYSPGIPQRLAAVQETLQQLQRSSDGWQLADRLSGSGSRNVRFFGALTFTVKLNSDSTTAANTSSKLADLTQSASLDPEDAVVVLEKIIGWLLRSGMEADSALVSNKLCSTLVVFFLQFSAIWTTCVRHMLYCLSIGEVATYTAIPPNLEIASMVRFLNGDRLTAAIDFCTTLAEEVGKTDSNNIRHHKFHDRLQQNVDDVVILVAHGLGINRSGEKLDVHSRVKAMQCFQAWVLYSHRALIDAAITLEPLRLLTKPAIACLVQEGMGDVTMELFVEVLGNYSRFLSAVDMSLLSDIFMTPWSETQYAGLTQDPSNFEFAIYGQFLIAYGDAIVQDLAKKDDIASQRMLEALSGLLHAEGYAVHEDQIFVPALEFWSTFIEVLVDSLYSEDIEAISSGTEAAFQKPRAVVLKAIEHCWTKIQFPPSEVFDAWDSVDRTGFLDARKDVADLLLSSYTLIGAELIAEFASLTQRALDAQAWSQLEASVFCLGALADVVSADDNKYDEILVTVFGSPLFSVLNNPESKVPWRMKQTSLALIGQYDDYFERHSQHLSEAFGFLFASLNDQSLANTASRSISTLCANSRRSLVAQLDIFLQQYSTFNSNVASDSLVKERVSNGIACIIQAIPTEKGKQGPLLQLLRQLDSDLQSCLALSSSDQQEEAESEALGLMRCLGSIARGLQAPTDAPLEIDGADDPSMTESFWITGKGAVVQALVQNIIKQLLGTFPTHGELIDAICTFFRAGFTERSPGPFVFSPSVVTQFLVHAHSRSARLGAVVSTACSFVSAHNSSTSDEVTDALRIILVWILSILDELKEPSNDPEIAQGLIDFGHRLLAQHLSILLAELPDRVEKFFMFTLQALTGRDPLPKATAADFWGSFVSLVTLPEDTQTAVDRAMNQLGPVLAEALMYNISGNAARSELDKMADPLKKLVNKQVRAKSWLETAMQKTSSSRDNGGGPSAADRRVFVQRVVNLRGARQTNQVVKEFWLACRGSNFAYAS